MNDDLRAELAGVAASLRAYLEVQVDSGAWGIPRAPRGARAVAPIGATAAAIPTANPRPTATATATTTATATATPTPNPTATANPTATPTATVTPTATPTPTPSPTPTPTPTPSAIAPATLTSTSTPSSSPALSPEVRLPLLAAEVSACTRCDLAKTRTQTVFARGNPAAHLCFIGEAPGADEDEQGIPFVGRAGQLLDRMIGAMGLSPERDVYVCNIIKCRPPGNRRPTPEESDACIPYLHEQIALIKPKVIVALGNTAVGTLLDTKLGITKLRGQWKLYRGTTLVMPTYHPSYLLRPSPQQADAKRQAWEDLRAVMRELKLPLPPPAAARKTPDE